MQFRKILITEGQELIEIELNYQHFEKDKAIIEFKFIRQGLVVFSFKAFDIKNDPFKYETPVKVIPKDAEFLFSQFRKLTGL